MQVDDDTWAEVRSAYSDGAVPLKEIAVRFGVTTQRIVTRAKKNGWIRSALPADQNKKASKKSAAQQGLPPRELRSRSRKPPAAAAAGQRLPTRSVQKSVIARLYRAITLKLEHMEERMASGEIRSAQDEERESRALATLINNFEKVTEAVAELDRDRAAVRASSAAGADAERMRREIAERLERLGGGGATGRAAAEPRS